MRVLSRSEIAETARIIASDGFCANICDLALSELHRLDPPRKISTLVYSREFRVFRKDDGTKVRWSLDKAPWASEVMQYLDNPNVREVVVPKPARCGGTVIAENYALKMMQFGPSGDIMWYLAGPGEVSSYADREFRHIFEDHSGVAEKVGIGKSDDKLTLKRIGSHTIELMAMSGKTTTNRQGRFIVFDEPDSYNPKFASNFMEQGRQRQRMVGNERKIYACAHPDIGWSGGISQAWLQSSRGIFVMQCPCCGDFASPYPTKHWADVPRFKLHYQKSPERTPVGERIKLAAKTAAMLCPNNGCVLDDNDRKAMIAGGQFMHEGQSLDIKSGIIGNPDTGETMGFWVHVLMVPQIRLPELAREMEGAIEHHERTGRSEKIKQVLVRTFGEAYEGAGDISGLDAAALRKRTKEMAKAETAKPTGYKMGEVPDGVKFITAAVDPGGSKFDYMIIGWDLQRRRYVIDRVTLKTRRIGERDVDIRPTKVQDDWNVLVAQVIDRKLPMQSDPTKLLPVAVTVIDSGDGNASANAYEFARRMDKKRWGNWRKVRCIKGAGSPNAPQLSPTPSLISKDDDGKPVKPEVTLHMVGAHSLKVDVLESLGIDDESAGQWFFPVDYPEHAYDEFFNEPLIEGKFIRNGPNESLDTAGYNEAARQMLEPDRETRRWNQERMPEGQKWSPEHLPIWAQPISIVEEGGDQAVAGEVASTAPAAKENPLARFDLNRR